MQRMHAWVLPVYALTITFLLFFQGWPIHQQSAAETQPGVPVSNAASKALPPAAEATAANPTNYLIPTPATPPRHLFHLIIRYEGDGLIDQNAVEVCKSCLMQASQEETKKTSDKPAPEKSASDKPSTAKSAGSNLFQFIVRYEGDGIIDKNVVEFVKAYMSAGNDQQEEANESKDRSPMSPSPATKQP